jgi:hypothetical protein
MENLRRIIWSISGILDHKTNFSKARLEAQRCSFQLVSIKFISSKEDGQAYCLYLEKISYHFCGVIKQRVSFLYCQMEESRFFTTCSFHTLFPLHYIHLAGMEKPAYSIYSAISLHKTGIGGVKVSGFRRPPAARSK